jgi:hypothetical protein
MAVATYLLVLHDTDWGRYEVMGIFAAGERAKADALVEAWRRRGFVDMKVASISVDASGAVHPPLYAPPLDDDDE